MNLTALLRAQHDRSGEQPNNINQFVANALIYIVENFFLQLATSFVLTLSYRDSHTSSFYNDLLVKLFKQWDAPPMQIVYIRGNHTLHVPGRRNFNLILIDSYESFRSIDVISYTAQYNNNEYYYIFLQARDHLLPAEMQRIFDYCWLNHLINCNVQVQTSKGEVLIYTYYPFSWKKCGRVTQKLINQFNGTTLLKPTLFPKKLSNFYGCTLRVATWNVPPFIYLEYFNNGSGRIIRGIEGRLLQELGLKLNFTIEVKVPPNNEQRGMVKGNNVTGALLMLRDRRVDLSLGTYRLSADRARVATATFSYYQNTQIICVPLEAYALTSLDILLFPFAASTWLLLLAIWIVIPMMVTLIKRVQGKSNFFSKSLMRIGSYLNLFMLAMGMPISLMPERYFARLLCFNWMFLTLVLRAVYQALLYHLIRTQLTNRVPQSFEELAVENYTIVMNRATFLALDEVSFLKALKHQIINNVDDTIQFDYLDKSPRKNLAAAGPLDFLVYYGSTYKKAGVFKTLSQSIVNLPITMYLTKHSYLVDQFDEEFFWFSAMGFIDSWSSLELDYKYLGLKQNSKDRIFDLEGLHMSFVLWIVGCGFSVLCVLLEIFSTKVKFLKKFLKN